MASSNSFITSLLLALVFSSMSLSLGARNLLQTTTQPNFPSTLPTLPNPTTFLPPLLPQGNNVPQLPTIPSLPQLNTLPPLPSIPTNIPSIPTTIPTTIPSIPFFSPPPSTTTSP
ncbi:hypothetical protein TanjilG_00391 [Lupinus angustifolius]|uniref:Uncharacterized protein n=1 Tax=Lupinus angustifolius TaxID=3871 RepID=A0A1J7I8M8_LUPAN|nr:PREDICTED: platelet glycoprotein Ib alpha chain-like [Lupinus angustifolius]OIW10453.1 hypothetical protein TanjilG_00391 [Lupinus angustifolius]